VETERKLLNVFEDPPAKIGKQARTRRSGLVRRREIYTGGSRQTHYEKGGNSPLPPTRAINNVPENLSGECWHCEHCQGACHCQHHDGEQVPTVWAREKKQLAQIHRAIELAGCPVRQTASCIRSFLALSGVMQVRKLFSPMFASPCVVTD